MRLTLAGRLTLQTMAAHLESIVDVKPSQNGKGPQPDQSQDEPPSPSWAEGKGRPQADDPNEKKKEGQ
ncbi:MAG: hypothetical protein FD126_372 [Elusimicrobia bacterium]|nr:MAG: hypothetical protein FD126_372 [Elusimicrobiota bacterium]